MSRCHERDSILNYDIKYRIGGGVGKCFNRPWPSLSGFHSPVECEALTVLLRGPGRLVWVPARAARAAGRLTIESPFDERGRRATAAARNRYVCDRAAAVLLAYTRPGGVNDALARELPAARKPLYTLDHPANVALLAVGAKVYRVMSDE